MKPIFTMRLSIILLTLFMASSVFSAQSVILKSGKTIKGQVIGQNESGLTVKQTDGTTTTIPKKQILKVVYKDVTADEEKKIRAEEEKKLAVKEAAEKKKREEAEKKKQAEEEAKRLAEEKKREKEKKDTSTADESIAIGDRSRWDIVWRSAVLPSWGMFHAERNVTGSIYSGLFWGTLLYSFQLRNEATSAKSGYDQATLLYQATRPDLSSFIGPGGIDSTGFLIQDQVFSQYVGDAKSQFKAKTNQYNGALGLSALLYIIQLSHSYFVGVDWEEGLGDSARGGFDMNSFWESNGVGMELRSQFGYTWKF
ncbi:MAG: hypothetical protein JJT78_01710 [Leptospira sp.]|nr:hypothetical protein [Leptospira sp.]